MQSNASKTRALAEIEFATGAGPLPHAPRFIDPREVENYFTPLLKNRPSPEQRWARKANSISFPGI